MRALWLALVLLILSISAVSAQVTVTRDLPDSAKVGDEITVTLTITIGSEKPAGAIIEEGIPDGASYVSSSPEATLSEGKLKWAFYGDQQKDMTVEYTLKVGKAGKLDFGGAVKTLLGNENIGGDSELEVSESKPAEQGLPQKTPGFEITVGIAALGSIAILRRFTH